MSWLLTPLTPTFEAALRDVTARGEEARIAAARRLAAPEPSQAPRAREGLARLASDPVAAVRAAAIEAMAEIGADSCLAVLAERMADPNPTVRELALLAVSSAHGDDATDHIRRALRSPHPELRFQAVLGYVERMGDDAVVEVGAALHDDDPKVRAHAARAAAVGRLSGLSKPLQQLLDDDFDEPRYEAALALATLGDACGASTLADAVTDPERALEALDALGGLEPGAHVEPIATLAASLLRPPWMKVAAARALLRLGDARGVAALRECLRGLRRSARSFAVEVVGELQVSELAPELARLARRPRGARREQVAEALARLAGRSPEARAALEQMATRRDAAGAAARRLIADGPPETRGIASA